VVVEESWAAVVVLRICGVLAPEFGFDTGYGACVFLCCCAWEIEPNVLLRLWGVLAPELGFETG
jgi:hypothetical protein